MVVETINGTVVIRWRHRPVESQELYNMATDCSIMVQEAKEHLYSGTARCSKKDNFCRETGRKISLARAMKDFNKELRKQIWEAYLGRKNNDRASRPN